MRVFDFDDFIKKEPEHKENDQTNRSFQIQEIGDEEYRRDFRRIQRSKDLA